MADAVAVYSAAVTKRSEPTVETVNRLRDQLKQMQVAKIQYPDIYRLRADLTEILPTADRVALLVEAQEDRLTYALLTDPNLRSKPEQERRMHALAMARPAIIMADAKLGELPDNWRAVLALHVPQISRAAAAVGQISASGRSATAFRIGRDLVVTVNFALNEVERPVNAELNGGATDPRIKGMSFCAADSAGAECPPAQQFPVTEVISDGGPNSYIAVLRVDFSSGPIESLKLRVADPERDALVDRYAYIIGYPHGGVGYPRDEAEAVLMDALLGKMSGIKRLLPGRTLALEADPKLGMHSILLTTDINTSVGTAGAPLVDLTTGEVVGVHIGGRRGEKGKLTFAELILPTLVQAIKAADTPAQPTSTSAAVPTTVPASGE